jgi:leucyl/phenylalanyl-tRNA---protein transferase
MIFQLSPDIIMFPDPALADDDGLLAIGGDLSEERLKLAYNNGIFPWYSEGEPILWYSPHERCVIFPEKIKVSKSMEQVFKKNLFTITADRDFKSVIMNCANTPRKDQDGTWITDDMQQAYINLHEKGIAHSVEVLKNDKLTGGLYGLQINNVFCGESMFSNEPNASKAALIWLCRNMNFTLIDCQLPNPHLMSMGAEMISREEYLAILTK